jgi:MYXO-CTERM domain-containing protein
MYCGVGANCATTDDGIDGCVCPVGTVARSISAPLGLGRPVARTVTCQVTAHDMLASARAEGTAPQDACINATCGDNGQCVDTNGFPTCTCDDGYAAITDAEGALTCSKIQAEYNSDAIGDWQRGCSCSSAAGTEEISTWALALMLLMPLAGLRRRRE